MKIFLYYQKKKDLILIKEHRRIFNRINLNYSEFILTLDKILKDFLVFYKEKM